MSKNLKVTKSTCTMITDLITILISSWCRAFFAKVIIIKVVRKYFPSLKGA